MSRMRKVIARRMRQSRDVSPSVSYNIKVDASALATIRKKRASNNKKVSYTDLLAFYVSRVLMEFPLLNCSVIDDSILLKHYVNLGIAVALDDGLVVPVIKDAHLKNLDTLSSSISSLASSAREGSLSIDDLQEGTFTITNLGSFGIEFFSPIINQPEVGILGVSAIIETIVCVGGEAVVKPMMGLTLVADHRVIDGSIAAQFLARLKQVIEQPSLIKE